MANAWHKALKNVAEYAPTIQFDITCTRGTGCLEPDHPGEPDVYFQYDLGLKKMDFVKDAKDIGWTWDKNGNWLCPACSKGEKNDS